MTTRTKTHVEPKSHLSFEDGVPATDYTTSYSHWMGQVVETMLDSEQKWLELASEQNELTLKALKQGTEFFRTVPTPPITEWVRRGEERFMEAQRRWIDTATTQREKVLRDMQRAEKEVEGTPTPNYKTLTDFTREQVESLVEARNRWLDFVAKQNVLFIQGVQETLEVQEATQEANRAKLVEETVDNYVEIQKRLFNVVAPEVSAESHKKTNSHHKTEEKTHQTS